MQPYVDDTDFTLYVGDALEVLRELPDESVDCVVTSPPYWGLRDYGTGEWEGGDQNCDHQPPKQPARKFTNGRGEGQGDEYAGSNLKSWTDRDGTTYRDVCGKCGATRVDQQLGLEPTPDQYVARMVEVFREVRRVLAAHGTCWVNLGDSYHGGGGFAPNAPSNLARAAGERKGKFHGESRRTSMARVKPKKAGGGFPCVHGIPLAEPCPDCEADQPPSTYGQGPPPASGWKRYMKEPDYLDPCPCEDGGPCEREHPGNIYGSDGNLIGRKDISDREFLAPLLGEDGGSCDSESRNRLSTGDRVRGPSVGSPILKPKDLVGIPWRVAFALQADGWYLRSDIIWAKPNPMPESVTDRPTKAHEYVFLLTKSPRYWFDAEAVREPAIHAGRVVRSSADGAKNAESRGIGDGPNGAMRTAWGFTTHDTTVGTGRNVRSVWEIATQPYPEAHFATFPEELARRCILAGCPERVCRVCGKPSERIVDYGEKVPVRGNPIDEGGTPISDMKAGSARLVYNADASMVRTDEGWSFLKRSINGSSWSECDCLLSGREQGPVSQALADKTRRNLLAGPAVESAPVSRPESKWRPGVVLDPFLGSGTTALVARNHGRHAIGIELSAEYAGLAAKRTRQLSLLA